MTGPRVTIRDLRQAAIELEVHAHMHRDNNDDPKKADALERVAEWLYHEIAGRRIAAENRAAQKRRRNVAGKV